MTGRQKNAGIIVSLLTLVAAIVLVAIGRGRLGSMLFILAGLGFGIFGPLGVSDGIHGAGDSTPP